MKRATIARRAAQQAGERTYFTGLACKRGHISQRLASNGTCTECLPTVQSAWRVGNEGVRASNAKYYEANRERLNAHNNRYNEANRDRLRAAALEHYQANKGRYRRWSASRRAAVERATPAWIDWAMVDAIYIEAERLSIQTGIPHEVDHEVPLRGKLVCGLHVAANLRVITKAENRSKAAKFDPVACGSTHSRDVNAARNILARGLSGPSAGTARRSQR